MGGTGKYGEIVKQHFKTRRGARGGSKKKRRREGSCTSPNAEKASQKLILHHARKPSKRENKKGCRTNTKILGNGRRMVVGPQERVTAAVGLKKDHGGIGREPIGGLVKEKAGKRKHQRADAGGRKKKR